MLVEGIGGTVDVNKAIELLKKAADQGLPGALPRLQKLLRSGLAGATGMTMAPTLVEKSQEKEIRKPCFCLE
jgi:TPR repeat protein